MVRAKFKVESITVGESADPDAVNCTVNLRAAYGPGNEAWSKWTPSGELRMHVTNPEAAAQFKVGRSYYVDFMPEE